MYVPDNYPLLEDKITFSIKNSNITSNPVNIFDEKRGVFDLEFRNNDLNVNNNRNGVENRAKYNFAFFSNFNHGL